MAKERTGMTVRELIEVLTQVAAELPGNLDVEVELGICDGENVTFVEKVGIDHYTQFSKDDAPVRQFVMLRGHLHPGQGKLYRGIAAEIDDDLRKLTDPEV